MSASRRKAGVTGWPLKHSVSPQFQQPAFDHLGLDVLYEAYEISPEALPGFVAGLRDGGWLGCNVTIPHKQDVFRLVDSLSEEARLIGAVNTIVNEGSGTLLGHNTDAAGFLRALRDEAGFEPAGKTAVILGARGSARAVAVGLVQAGIGDLYVANRTESVAAALVDELDRQQQHSRGHAFAALPLEADALRRPLAEASLLVNCTSVGMAHGPAPDALPLPNDLLGPHLLVYDLVYNPARTPLLRAAAAAGAQTQEGLPMLVYQGAASFERWTGRPAPVDVMLRAARAALAEREARDRSPLTEEKG